MQTSFRPIAPVAFLVPSAGRCRLNVLKSHFQSDDGTLANRISNARPTRRGVTQSCRHDVSVASSAEAVGR